MLIKTFFGDVFNAQQPRPSITTTLAQGHATKVLDFKYCTIHNFGKLYYIYSKRDGALNGIIRTCSSHEVTFSQSKDYELNCAVHSSERAIVDFLVPSSPDAATGYENAVLMQNDKFMRVSEFNTDAPDSDAIKYPIARFVKSPEWVGVEDVHWITAIRQQYARPCFPIMIQSHNHTGVLKGWKIEFNNGDTFTIFSSPKAIDVLQESGFHGMISAIDLGNFALLFKPIFHLLTFLAPYTGYILAIVLITSVNSFLRCAFEHSVPLSALIAIFQLICGIAIYKLSYILVEIQDANLFWIPKLGAQDPVSLIDIVVFGYHVKFLSVTTFICALLAFLLRASEGNPEARQPIFMPLLMAVFIEINQAVLGFLYGVSIFSALCSKLVIAFFKRMFVSAKI